MPRLPTLLSIALIALAGCSAQETPRKAEPVQAQAGYTDLGGLRVHYNLLPTLAMNDAGGRTTTLKLVQILYQPEAAGDVEL